MFPGCQPIERIFPMSTLLFARWACRAVVALLLLAAAVGAESAEPKPNVLILVSDDQGWGDLGVQGAEDLATPNLDAIARQGVRFTDGYVAASVCSVSRAGLITGRAPTRFGFEFNHALADLAPFGLPATEKTAAELFRAAGYGTGHIGKWHIGSIRDPAQRAEGRGFDESLWFVGQNKLAPIFFFRHGGEDSGSAPAAPGARRMAERLFPDEPAKWEELRQAEAGYVDTAMTQEASAFIERQADRPWFLYVGFLTPHTPMAFPPGTEEEVAGIRPPNRQKCVAMLGELDRCVGTLLETLRKTGQLERTLIFFVSDNGGVRGNASSNGPLRSMKGTLFEGGIRVPFLMQWPGGGIPAGLVVDEPVSSLDILPTALAAAGVAPREAPDFDGVDLLPFLRGETKEPPHQALCWRYGKQMAVRRGNWKLVRSAEKDPNVPGADIAQELLPPLRLHDLSADIGEQHDLSAEEPEKVAELQALWDEWDRANVPALWNYNTPTGVEPLGGGEG
jgi:arylsulfatase A-like enzyme